MLIAMELDVTRDPQLLKGVLPMLVLSLLHQQESYGYELVTRLRSRGLASIAPGTVYPVLTRLEREGQLTSYLMASSAGPARKYYRPTPAGTEALKHGVRTWQQLTGVVSTILSESPTIDDGAAGHGQSTGACTHPGRHEQPVGAGETDGAQA